MCLVEEVTLLVGLRTTNPNPMMWNTKWNPDWESNHVKETDHILSLNLKTMLFYLETFKVIRIIISRSMLILTIGEATFLCIFM